MPPEGRDQAYLWDMLTAAREAVSFVEGITFVEFESHKVRRYAVERQLLVLGEAARHVSDQFRREHPSIPWAGIVGLRNILAHEYGEILVDRVWVAATERLPELIRFLESLTSERGDESQS